MSEETGKEKASKTIEFLNWEGDLGNLFSKYIFLTLFPVVWKSGTFVFPLIHGQGQLKNNCFPITSSLGSQSVKTALKE